VLAEDGYTYEKSAILYWLDKEAISPITEEPMGKKITEIKQFKKLIAAHLEKNPSLVDCQFLKKKPYYLFRDEFTELLLENSFNQLTNYTHILVTDFIDNVTVGEYIFVNCRDNSIIKILIDNSIDYDSTDDYGSRLIHLAAIHSNQEIVKHLIDKCVDINCKDLDGNTPIHYVTLHQQENDMIIDHMLQNSATIYNNEGLLPIHNICKDLSSWDILEPYLTVDLSKKSSSGLSPFHYICKSSRSIDIIKKFIDLDKYDLIEETVTINESEVITPDQLIYTNPYLTQKEKQETVHYYLNKLFSKPVIVENYFDGKRDINIIMNYN
jgi:ankyrin repeat protein